MQLTISLDEPLAEQLRQRASAKDLSPEQTARDLLGQALARLTHEEAWRELNQRRRVLLQKSRQSSLTSAEIAELERLEATIDERLAPTDRQLLAVAEEFRERAERLPDATARRVR